MTDPIEAARELMQLGVEWRPGMPDLTDDATFDACLRQVRDRWFSKFKNPAALAVDVEYYHDGKMFIAVTTAHESIYSQGDDMHRIDALLAAARAAFGGR